MDKHTVPNVVHFIYPVWRNTRPLSYMNYIAVKRAAMIQKPDKIKFWINGEPATSPYWEMIKPLVEINFIEMDDEFQGVRIDYPQLRSDVTRLQILYREGGIYMDTDMFLLHGLDDYRYADFALCREPSGTGKPSACNALLIASPEAEFAAMWLDEMADALQNGIWAYGGVILPHELSEQHPHHVTMFDHKHFCPFGLERDWLFATDPATIEQAETMISSSTAVHAFETFWRNVRPQVDVEWCRQNDTLFSRLAK